MQDVYDLHRYLTLRATASFRTPALDVDKLSVEELVFNARLASRLGGDRLSKSLCMGREQGGVEWLERRVQ